MKSPLGSKAQWKRGTRAPSSSKMGTSAVAARAFAAGAAATAFGAPSLSFQGQGAVAFASSRVSQKPRQPSQDHDRKGSAPPASKPGRQAAP